MSNNPGSLKLFGMLCTQVTAESSMTIKEEIIRGFISWYAGDLGLLLKLLLPKYSNRIYHAQEKQLLRVLSLVQAVPEDDLKNLWNRQGCIAETAQKNFRATVALDRDGWGDMSLTRFDGFLDQMAATSNETMRVVVVREFMKEACTNAVYLFFREVKLDLRLGAGLRIVLKGLHPSAYEIFQHCADVQEVVRRVQARGSTQSLPDDNADLDDEAAPVVAAAPAAAPAQQQQQRLPGAPEPKPAAVRRGAVTAQIKLGMPLAPMLAAPAKSVEQALAKCPNGAFSEVKYDGERMQIHKQGDSLTIFARSLKPMQPAKYEGLEPYLRTAIKARECILDGEILLVDINTSVPLPFGTLGKHKCTQFTTACPCVFVFDILYKDGESLLQMPLEERREELKKAVQFTRNRVMYSELCLVKGDMAQRRAILQQHLNRAIAEGLEGLMIKDVKGVYEPRARHWLKLKKDYLEGLADSADLLVLGAWYGSGNKGGQLSTFLMGCIDTAVPAGQPRRYRTVCKVGNGLDDVAISVLTTKYTQRMTLCASGAVPAWLDCQTLHVPDMVMRDPSKADVMEIIGAELTITKSHTAGLSVRFPRILRVRTDKNADTATNLQELLQLYRTSKEKLTAAGVPGTLQLIDSYVIVPPGGDGDGGDSSNSMPPAQQAAAAAAPGTAVAAVPAPAPEGYTLAPSLAYVKGDATKPDVPKTESVVICHSSAVGGAWSHRGFMGQVTRTYGDGAARAYAQSVGKRGLGDVVITEVGDAIRPGHVYVATMMGQAAGPRGEVPPVDQAALLRCLSRCIGFARQNNAALHIVQPPDDTKVDWAAVDAILRKCAADAADGVRLVVYGAEPANRKAPVPADPPAPAAVPDPAVAAAVQPERRKREWSPAAPAAAATPTAPTTLSTTTTIAIPTPSDQPTALPHSWWSLLKDVRAQVVGADPALVEDLAAKLGMVGAKTVHSGAAVSAKAVCTHVILAVAPGEEAPQLQTAAPQGAAVVTGQWVDDCLGLQTRFAEELYSPRRLAVLAGCRLFLAPALPNRPEWERLASLLGAALHPSWRLIGDRSTHCVSGEWDADAEKVFDLGGRVVSPQWLVDSAVAQAAIPARPYLLTRPRGRKSTGAAPANPLEGILCGLRVCVMDAAQGPTESLLARAAEAAVRQMGGEPAADPEAAQYCLLTAAAYAARGPALTPAVRFCCVDPEWLWESARRRSLQDPAGYAHNGRAKAPGPATAAADEDGHSLSSYSTDTYVEEDRELQGDAPTEEDEESPALKVPRK